MKRSLLGFVWGVLAGGLAGWLTGWTYLTFFDENDYASLVVMMTCLQGALIGGPVGVCVALFRR